MYSQVIIILYILFTDDLDSRELEAEGKKIVIEVKSNEQGRFFKIIEVRMGEILNMSTVE